MPITASTLHEQTQLVLPAALQHDTIVRTQLPTRPIKRRMVSNQTTYTPGQVAQLRLENVNALISGLRLMFEINVTKGSGGTYACVANGAWSVIDRIQLYAGSRLIDDCPKYNLFHSLMHQCTASPTYPGNDAILGYTATQTTRRTNAASYRYILPLYLVMRWGKVIPTHLVREQLRIDITFANAADCLESDATSAHTYTVSNLELLADTLDTPESYHRYLVGVIKSSSLKFHHKEIETFDVSIPSGITTYSVPIPIRVRSLKMILALMRQSNELTDFTKLDRLMTYKPFGLQSFQWRLGGTFFPPQPILVDKGAPEAWVCLHDCFQSVGPSNYRQLSYIDGSNFTNTRFIMAANFDLLRSGASDGLNTADMAGESHLLLTFSAPTTTTITLTLFAICDQVTEILPNGLIDYSK